MEKTGDIAEAVDIAPPTRASLGDEARAKVAMVNEILQTGGVAHVYLNSIPALVEETEDVYEIDDLHLYPFNTHVFAETGWLFSHAEDVDMWIPGNDIGAIERHYER